MNIVSLFAGCGGLDLGFKRAGFRIIWANEYDSSIHSTYRQNHPDTILNTSDIRELEGTDIPACDGIIGGPPCQAWSEGGKRLGIEDPRGQLFFEYIRIVKEKKPKFFLIENVQGILDEKHKDSLKLFIRILQDAGYRISYELLNAADYNIPQDRFRVFFIGIRNDLKVDYKFPNAVTKSHITLRKAIGDIVEEPRYYSNEVVPDTNLVRSNHDTYTGSYDLKYMSRNRVRSWNEVSFTMQAQARNAPQHPQAPKMTFISNNKRAFRKGYEHLYRRLSVRECARIQSFPDNFIFIYSDIKDGYKMVGNAVPPRLSWHLALSIKNAFSNTNEINTVYIPHFTEYLDSYKIPISTLKLKYPTGIITNTKDADNILLNKDKNLLVGLIPAKNSENFLNRTAQTYYSGKFFPCSINLDGLYYFMPYIKGKGIKDLYLIRSVRVGSKPNDSNLNNQRLIFQIEYICQIFNTYVPLHLNIWHTFTDTTMRQILRIKEKGGA